MTISISTNPESRTVVLHLETSETHLTYTAFRKLIQNGLLEAVTEVSGIQMVALQEIRRKVKTGNPDGLTQDSLDKEQESLSTWRPNKGEFWFATLPGYIVPEVVQVDKHIWNEVTLLVDGGKRCCFFQVGSISWHSKLNLKNWDCLTRRPQPGEFWRVLITGFNTLQRVYVAHCDRDTVGLKPQPGLVQPYPHKDVTFIEKCESQEWGDAFALQPAAGEFWMVKRTAWARPARIHIENIGNGQVDYSLIKSGMIYCVARGDITFLHKTDSQEWEHEWDKG